MAASISDETTAPGARSRSQRAWWLVAIVAGLLLGPLDLLGQVRAPYPLAHLFNSPAAWAAAAFAFGWWVSGRVASVVGATIVMIVGVESYYLADVMVRGADRSNLTSSTAAVWFTAGVGAGVVFGTAGWWVSARSGWREVVGRAALPAVLGAEGVHNALRVVTERSGGRPDDLGWFAGLLVLLAAVAMFLMVRDVRRPTMLRVATVAIGAALLVGTAANLAI